MIHTGDCIEVMRTLDADSVDAVVTDPPYGIEFMGKKWDSAKPAGFDKRTRDNAGAVDGAYARLLDRGPVQYIAGHPFQAWCTEWGREALRVTKPGGYLLAFGGTRTHHRLVCGLEDAGWEIRDELTWIFASGFPKSLDVSKALDKAAGAEREVTGTRKVSRELPNDVPWGQGLMAGNVHAHEIDVTAPATDLAKKYVGYGTALKPAHEPIVLARKPLVGSVAANVTRYGTGALNIDGTRIGTTDELSLHGRKATDNGWDPRMSGNQEPGQTEGQKLGRWPSNLLLQDPELFDTANPGVVGSGAVAPSAGTYLNPDEPPDIGARGGGAGDGFLGGLGQSRSNAYAGDTGGYSRFFLIPKSARADREPVLRGQLEAKQYQASIHADPNAAWADKNPNHPRENSHPTVKPVDLMRHLVRLVTPSSVPCLVCRACGGTVERTHTGPCEVCGSSGFALSERRGVVLDCFLGSGSTAIACEMEGFPWIGVEQSAEYVAIAEARLNGVQRGLGLDAELVGEPRKASLNKPVEWKSDGDGTDGTRAYGQGVGQRKAGSVRGGYDQHLMTKPEKPTADTAPLWTEPEEAA